MTCSMAAAGSFNGMIVLDERLTWRTLLGGVCIMMGIGLIVLRRIKDRERASAPQIPREGGDAV